MFCPVDPEWELLDPTPDIHALFVAFDDQFFYGKLAACEVKWSPRMTICAGVCSYHPRSGLCSIRLSKPLLTFRPRRDLVETLLHEMIHAYLFVTKRDRDRDGHGPDFQYHMKRINSAAGTKITIYHNFHNEVRSLKTHWWRCDGLCKNKSPFYGWVKRSMNRAPGPNDYWWHEHQSTCGGSFIKVREPEGYQKKNKRTNSAHLLVKKRLKKTYVDHGFGADEDKTKHPKQKTLSESFFIPFSGKGHVLGGASDGKLTTSPVGQVSPVILKSPSLNFLPQSLNDSPSSKASSHHSQSVSRSNVLVSKPECVSEFDSDKSSLFHSSHSNPSLVSAVASKHSRPSTANPLSRRREISKGKKALTHSPGKSDSTRSQNVSAGLSQTSRKTQKLMDVFISKGRTNVRKDSEILLRNVSKTNTVSDDESTRRSNSSLNFKEDEIKVTEGGCRYHCQVSFGSEKEVREDEAHKGTHSIIFLE
ncbi:hypothetical protein AB6A40_003498 [Gnathostoma spinigerum]|uniref:SprT-like domain-containing protein n=1 Tax=Gnathostoma spinigerum TaxID=75299 RepID=A0ABD6EHH2_9BILA